MSDSTILSSYPEAMRLVPMLRGALTRFVPGGRVTLAVVPGGSGSGEGAITIAPDADEDAVIRAVESAIGEAGEGGRAIPRHFSVAGLAVTAGSTLCSADQRADDEFLSADEIEGRDAVMRGRVALVTGGAQGFGAELVDALVDAGARVFIVDLNAEGAAARSAEINAVHGPVSSPIAADISDEASVEAMMERVVEIAGGLDLLVSNAGVVRAGSVKSLELSDFELVTRVNYNGFFLCTRAASRVMAAQNAVAPETVTSDIIQINSKSGLTGSNKNGAYAGSKFGGIGLVQSFALELAADRIKVNAICPGNFLDGPLWSHPEKGLFVQYLQAGKVPGAKTVADVKRHYERQVPLGRGCTGLDVARALLYIVEQQYETGQAVPVTGGQIMVS